MSMVDRHDRLRMVERAVTLQATDAGLWTEGSIGEAYIQQALRDLHRVIEHGDTDALNRIADCAETSSPAKDKSNGN